MTLSRKLRVAFLALGLLAIGLTDWQARQIAADALTNATEERLITLREIRRQQIESYFSTLRGQLQALSNDEASLEALVLFHNAILRLNGPKPGDLDRLERFYWDEFLPKVQFYRRGTSDLFQEYWPGNSTAARLQALYLARNPHPIGKKDAQLAAPGDTSGYSDVHRRYHPTFRNYLQAFGFYDLFLVEVNQGVIVYTVFKEIDLGRSLRNPPYNNTGIAAAFERGAQLMPGEPPVIQEYTPYVPSFGAPASFMAAPIFEAGRVIGVLIGQVSIDEVNRVMTGDYNWIEEGLGKTGETYIVGPDRTLRSHPRQEIEAPDVYLKELRQNGMPAPSIERIRQNNTSILVQQVRQVPVEKAFSGESGLERVSVPGRGEVLAAYTPVSIPGLNWVLIAQIDAAEAFEPVAEMGRRFIALGLLVSALFLLAGSGFARSITGPILALVQRAEQLGRGNFRARIEVSSSDEIGRLAGAFNRMAEELERTTVSKAYLDDLLESMINAVLVVDILPGGSGRVRTGNRAAQELLGYSAAELSGMRASELVRREGEGRDWLREVLAHGRLPAAEVDLVAAGGRTIPALFTAARVTHDQLDSHSVVCVAQDITARKVAEDALRALTGRLLSAQEEERARLARELHDDVTQRLAVVAMKAGQISRSAPAEAEELQGRLRALKDEIAALSTDIHGLSRRLHPAMLHDLGLRASVLSEIHSFRQREEIEVEYYLGDGIDDVRGDAALAVYRVVQEALRNVARHAHADRVMLRLETRPAEGASRALHLTVQDNGKGFDPAQKDRPGIGLASMEERVRHVEGQFRVTSAPGAGTLIEVTLPPGASEPGEANEPPSSTAG